MRDCGLDQHLQKVYAKAKYNAEQAVQSATTDNGLHELQKNQETLNKSIAILETLPRDAKVSPQLDQEIKVYRQQLNLLSNLISKQQALNKSLAPIPYSAAPQLPPKTGHSPQVSTNLNDSKPAYRPESSSRRAIRRTKKLSTNSKIARTNGRKKASRSIPKPSKTLEPLWGEGAKNSSLEPLW